MDTISQERAREIVDKIRMSLGGISAAERAETSPAVLSALDSVRRQLGAATQIVATNLYSEKVRFVYELVQNAEDNNYVRAEEAEEDPFLLFGLYPDKIVIDSNEDGFDEDNVKSICSTGESSKSLPRYIGEKGIGFKSVFKIATKVHIQSGPFSFFFEHRPGDGGLGMVTPNYEPHRELPPDVRTRMTLTLIDDLDTSHVHKDFYGLPKTLLLFLSKLKRITITRADALGPESEITYSKRFNKTIQHATLTKHLRSSGVRETKREKTLNDYHITERLVASLPKVRARLHYNQALVILAFPLDRQAVPILEQQHVFAYLPIRQFAIQSDFITGASREDVEDNPWNNAILLGVAKAFRDAVLDFCDHPTLQFQWMRYMPSTPISTPFWAQLLPEIVRLLKETRVLRPWSGGSLKHPDQLRRVPDYYLDEMGTPLFKDTPDEVYLSAKYEWSDFQRLDVLAVKELSFLDISTRVRRDLTVPSSRWKSALTSDEWVTRSASMLVRPLNMQGSTGEAVVIKALPLIPLRDGTWVSGDSGSIFHPESDRLPVPTDLGLRLVDPQALQNPARKALFTKLGLRNCVTKDVVASILKKYNTWSNAPLQCSISHLCYLYWHLPKNERDLPKTIYLKDQSSRPIYRSYVTYGKEIDVDDLYFETDERYEVKQLVKRKASGSNITFPGFAVHYINRAYMDAMPSEARRYDVSWEGWLGGSAGVRRIPRLVRPTAPTVLSDLFLYIKKWRKEELVGTLKAHWASYKDIITPPVISALREATVPCDDGTDAPLRTTYVPLPKLMKICKKVEVGKEMPFLTLPLEVVDEAHKDWEFLGIFDVGYEISAKFYLDVLRRFVRTHQSLSEKSRESLLRIYEAIAKYSTADDRQQISKSFAEEDLIYVTAQESQPAVWTKPEGCVWKAPEFLTEWHALSNLEGFRENNTLRHLFSVVLNIGDADWTYYLHQIEVHKEKGIPPNKIQEIYRRLYSEIDKDEWEYVRRRFEEGGLVYEPLRRTWHPPTSCLWTDDTRISGKIALIRHYADLQAFFVQRLGVEEPDIDTYITELQLLTTNYQTPPLEKVKGLIKEINSFEPRTGALDRLTSSNILPVKGLDDKTGLSTTSDLFAIVDRSGYGSAFQGKVPVLDFSIEDVRDLRPIISALDLEGRYMSRLVIESSEVKDSSRKENLSSRVQKRAYALLRCACYYGSPHSRSRSLYNKFQATDVYESDGISKTITLTLKDLCISVEGAKGIVHIAEDDQQMQFYVPRNKEDRELSYCTELPEKLVAQLDMEGIEAVRVVGDILTKSLSVLEKMLDHHGIVRVAGIEPTPQTVSDDLLSDEDDEQPVSHRTSIQPEYSPSTPVRRGSSASAFASGSAPNSTSRAGSSSYVGSALTPQSSQAYAGFPSTPSSTLSPFPNRRGEDTAPEMSTSRHEYHALLDRVIRAASRAPFPRAGVPLPEMGSDSSDATSDVLSDAVFGRRSDGKVNHDVKIGAAGELYAFEFLLNQLSPNFDQSNWRSTIRKEVCVHEKYRNMPAWNGRETADITYQDQGTENPETSFKLTDLLYKNGYFPNGLSVDDERGSINYYLEVKTTTLGCGTRLFVSKAQYQRMHEMALHPWLPAKNIYVIMRVFNLGQEDMGMRIYVDPATMERNGELQFQAETYTVVPAAEAVEEEL